MWFGGALESCSQLWSLRSKHNKGRRRRLNGREQEMGDKGQLAD